VNRQIINALIISGILGGITYLIRLNKLGERIQYRLLKVSRNKSTTLQSSSITAEIELINPTNTSLDVQSVSGFIFYGNQVLGSMESKKPFTITPGSSRLSLNFSVDNQSLLTSIVQYVLRQDQMQKIVVRYNLKTTLGVIPQSFEVNPRSLI